MTSRQPNVQFLTNCRAHSDDLNKDALGTGMKPSAKELWVSMKVSMQAVISDTEKDDKGYFNRFCSWHQTVEFGSEYRHIFRQGCSYKIHRTGRRMGNFTNTINILTFHI